MALAVTRTTRARRIRVDLTTPKKSSASNPQSQADDRPGTSLAQLASIAAVDRIQNEDDAISDHRKLEIHSNHDEKPAQDTQPNSTGRKKSRKSSWDPLARYHSEAHSFPDYGTSSDMMASRRVRDINGSSYRPMNTFSQPRQPTDTHIVVGHSPPAKRQKHDRDTNSSYVKSPYFGSPDGKHSTVSRVDLISNGSQDDVYEVKSSSSVGKSKVSSMVGLDEYRHSQPKIGKHKKLRERRSRTESTLGQALTDNDRPSLLETEISGAGSMPGSWGSPDILADQESGPPPANVRSDIYYSSPAKRMRPGHSSDQSSPHVKRPRVSGRAESIESEDELNRQGPELKRATNFSSLTESPRKAKSRGDIERTVFKKPLSRPQAQFPVVPDLCVKAAVCGKHVFPQKGSGHIVLHQTSDSVIFAPRVPDDFTSEIGWLSINLETADSVHHAAARSRFVCINRPIKGDSGRTLWLEFVDKQDVMNLIQATPSDKSKERPIADIENRWRKSMTDALNYKTANRLRTDAPPDSHSFSSAGLSTSHEKHGKAAVNAEGSHHKPERLVDRMKAPEQTSENQLNSAQPGEATMSASRGVATRRTRRSSPVYVPRELSPDRWSAMNPDWRKKWHKSLVFPATGRNRATVDDNDISRLDEGEFLNDNLISFYVRYLQFKLESEKPELLKKVYFFNTFFFEKLRSTRGKINYDGVKAWTAKFDLLTYDYIVVPVNENAHWYLAIICNTPNALNGMPEVEEELKQESPKVASIERDMSDVSIQDHDEQRKKSPDVRTRPSSQTIEQSSSPRSSKARASAGDGAAAAPHVDPRTPKIVTLDSLGSAHATTCKALKEYLMEEARDKKGTDLAIVPNGMTAKRIPEQDNFCDCGVYILGYMEEFLKDPDETVRKLLQKEPVRWDIRPSRLRNEVRELLFKLQDEQQERLQKEKEEKRRLAKLKKKQPVQQESTPAGSIEGKIAPPPKEQSAVEGETSTTPKPLPESGHSDDARREEPESAAKGKAEPVLPKQTPLHGPKDDSSVSASSPADEYVSAPTSPNRQTNLEPALAIKPSSVNDHKSGVTTHAKIRPEPNFVQGIPDSSSEVEVTEKPAKKHKHKHKQKRSLAGDDQVELIKDSMTTSPSRSTRQTSKQRSSESPTFVKPLRSSQSESPKQPRARYVGIDRSVDLT